MSTRILDVEGVSKEYTEYNNGKTATKKILKDISFSLNKGEALGIIGLNGSGKSTLLKIISGIVKPSQGKVTHFGKFSAILDLGFGMIPELTGRENIHMIGRLEGLSSRAIKFIEEEIIYFSELENAIHNPVKFYSNGMFLRLAFSIKIFFPYDLLIIDEIINVGDILFQEKCFRKIKELSQAETGLILVTHNVGELIEYTSQAIQIENGSIKYLQNTVDVVNKYIMDSKEKSLLPIKSNKDFTGSNNKNILIENVSLSKEIIKMDERLEIKFDIVILTRGDYDIILFISDFKGIVLSDSFSYRNDFTKTTYEIGKSQKSCIVPANIFNKGKFYIGFVAADRNGHYFENYYLTSFEVQVSEWDEKNVWNKEQKYFPLRPHLLWM